MPENSDEQYLVRDPQGNVYGPADVATLRQWVHQGRIVAGMYVAPKETGAWVEVSTHPGLADLLTPSAAQPITAATAPQAAPAVSEATSPVTPVSPASSAPPGAPFSPEPGQAAPLAYDSNVPRANVPGLLSMIAGILGALGLPLGCVPVCSCIGLPFVGVLALTAIILGAIGLHQYKSEPARYAGKGAAVAGLSLGIGVILVYVATMVISMIVGFHNHP